ncbi:CHC2 zinc finger domain-containing protein, partial [Spirosoma sp. 48-14]
MFDDARILDELKALDILQIARDLGREPNRQNLIHCTFHDEKTPSMKLYPKDGHFKCFGCGKSGSTIDLYMSAGQGMEFGQAVKEMKSRYLGIVDDQPLPKRVARPVAEPVKAPTIPAEKFSPIYASLQTFCRQYVSTQTKRQALAYLTGRAFTVDIIRRFGLFVIPDPKATADFLTSTYEHGQLESAGLFTQKGYFLFSKHPIIIPYLKNGQIVNLQGRCIGEPDEKMSKYQFLK